MKANLNQTSAWAIAVFVSLLVFGLTVVMFFQVADSEKHRNSMVLEARRAAEKARKQSGESPDAKRPAQGQEQTIRADTPSMNGPEPTGDAPVPNGDDGAHLEAGKKKFVGPTLGAEENPTGDV